MRPPLRALAADPRGATLVEFALVVPVLLTLILGLGELSYQAYVQETLTGAVQKAGRDAAIQGGATQTAQIDGVVIDQLTQLGGGWKQDCSGSPPATARTYCSSRKSYASYGSVAAEPFDDNDNNGIYNAATDCYTDINGNKTWDADPGASGQGGANDVAVYVMKVSYPRLFPVFALFGMSNVAALTGSTVLKNQPYASQVGSTPQRICPK